MLSNEQIAEKIKRRRTEMGLTLGEVAEAVGVATSTIQRYESGRITTCKIPVLNSIAAALKVTPHWLYGDDELPANVYPADMTQMVRIPVIGRVAGGVSCHAEQNIEYYEFVQKDIIRSGDTYVYLNVVGDSMSPKIMEGDIVLVRCQPTVDSGDYAVVLIDNEDGVVKKVMLEKDSVTLISENPYYPPRVFRGEEMSRIRIFGKVIESKRKF
ncbi:MAG: LexA family protein [Oscillospiraceae bacterium]